LRNILFAMLWPASALVLLVTSYRSSMEAKGLPPEVQEMLVEQYKNMPEWQRKLTIQGYQ